MLVPMAKVEIIGPKNQFMALVSLLHEQGTLHVEDLSKKIQSGKIPLERMEMAGDDLATYDQFDELLIRVRAILKTLNAPETGVEEARRRAEYERMWSFDAEGLSAEVADIIGEVEDKTADLASLHTAAEAELSLLARYEPILGKIQPLAKQIVVTGSFDSVALLVERRYKAGLEHLQQALDKITNSQCEIISTDIDEDTTAAIVVYSRMYAEPVHKFLSMENVNQIRLPQDFQDMPLDVAYDEIKQRRAALPGELDRIRAELAELSERWFVKLTTARDVLADRLDELVAIPKFGRTEYAFVIEGWLPVDDLPTMRGLVRDDFGDEIIITQLELDEHEFEEAPVALKNPKWAEPFQGLLGFMGMPKYGTYDPTWMLALFYPLFFGMIVGDIGYGIIMLGTVIWLRVKYKENTGVQMATSILGPAATMAIVFGFIYGEFFGNLLGPHFMNVIVPIYMQGGQVGFGAAPEGATQILPFMREEMVTVFLVATIVVGVLQVLLGLGIGVYNGLRTKHMSHVYEKGGVFAFVVGFIALILGVVFASVLQSFGVWVQAIGGLVLFLGLAFAIKGGKVMGAIESIEALTKIASYLRIMAVGLAGAIFANAANEIAASVGSWVVGLLVAIPLQALNFVIAAFSPNIHAIRLNFLEFFGRFYETGDKQYRPFHKTGGEKSA